MIAETLLPLLALNLAEPPVYHGRAGKLEVEIPRMEVEVEIDGRLDESVWRRAAVLTGFSTYLPVDGRAAEDSTEVLLWFSPTALHVGIRAFEPHGPVRAAHADRDRLDAEDHVQILLDTFGEERQAYVLAVNALGLQADGVRLENRVNFEAKPGLGNVDLSVDLLFDSRGRVTDWGYEVELRIPFKSLRYSRSRESWRVNVVRQVQHSGHQSVWAPVLQADASFLARSGTLTGLVGIRQGVNLEVNPVLTTTTAGQRQGEGWRYHTEPELGGNARWGITPDLTLNATYNPDFSQVEADAGQIPGDARYAIAFAERRPFFVDGADLFDVPSRLVYTRRIVEPLAAIKLAGKVAGTEVGVLSAVENRALSESGDEHPLFQIVRLRRGIGGGSTVGALFTDRSDGRTFNRVAGVDSRLLLGATRLGLQGAMSATRGADGRRIGSLWTGSVSHNARHWGLFQYLGAVHPDFQTESGLIDRSNAVRSQSVARLTHFGGPDGMVENLGGRVILDGLWLYDDFFDGHAPLETKVWLEGSLALRGGWKLMLTRMFEAFAFDPGDYADYRVERPAAGGEVEVAPFQVSPRQHTGGWYLVGNSPKFQHLSVSVSGFVGYDPYFLETLRAFRTSFETGIRWTPGERLRVDASYAHNEFRRPDGSSAQVQDIPRLKLEYQLARPLFVRLISQYHAQETAALRDPGSGAAILVPDGAGGYRPSEPAVRNDLRLDGLISYQPTPGTVIFLGYGSSMAEPDRLALRDLRRTRDAFFVKLSYVFRS
jgi:hypothetical protein